MAYMSDEALERKLEQQAAMISALIKTRSLLAAQAQEQQLLLASLAQSIEFNVSHAHGARAKRKLATDCSLESGPRMLADEAVVWRSADALGEAPIGNDMPAAERARTAVEREPRAGLSSAVIVFGRLPHRHAVAAEHSRGQGEHLCSPADGRRRALALAIVG
jgi:hypothetical protein